MAQEKKETLEKEEEVEEVELSEEDAKIKEEVEELVDKIQGDNQGVAKLALETLRTMLKTATGTVTSIPKPLKFLRPHYPTLKENFTARPNTMEGKKLFADLLSLLAMSYAKEDVRECLTFKLQGDADIAQWGHEYIRHLSGEIGTEYHKRKETAGSVDDLMALVTKIVPFDFTHNSEPQACDLLLEVERLPHVVAHCTSDNHRRVCDYLLSYADYVASPGNREIQKVAYDIYLQLQKYPEALRTSMMLNDRELIKATLDACKDPILQKQLAFQLGRQRIFLDPTGDDELDEIIGNAKLSEFFLYTARDLNSMDPKTPEQIYKTHLQDQRTTTLSANISSHTQNLASTFVNAFANAGFCTDKLMTAEVSQVTEWLHKNKDHRMMSAAASLGMIMLWDVDDGLAQVDKFLYSNEEYIKAGALMAVGILHSGVRNDCDPALALLSDYLENKTTDMRVAAIMGLGLSYAGSKRTEISELLVPMVADSEIALDICVFAALSLGLVFVGTCDENITEIITTQLMERCEKEGQVSNSLIRFFCVALGLLFLGQHENVEAAVVACSTLNPKIAKYCEMTVKTCAYAGSGDLVQIKELMKQLVEKIEKEEEASHQSVAVMGIGLIAMGEVLGSEMCKRTFEHILQYGDAVMRRAIPLALALVYVSNPQLIVLDTLGKLTHDPDSETSMNAILALGLVGAGTNNARTANMLRQLANYYAKEANHLFLVRVAQGMLFMGKGLLTMNPFHSDRKLMNHTAVAGLLIVLHSGLDMKSLILSKYHFLLYYLVTAISPRMMVTLDNNLEPVQVSVRVGQSVDTVAVPGRPKTITGFQTHNSPVLLQFSDRAELATDKWKALTPILEDVVILEKNKAAAEDEPV
jgi:26S proteasome regulatory subunit N1|eukprot:CAMPEP_0174303016 /NCGR_PEP_ID=MMETSP0809-20121228/59940_1 /TAXON_ID=73025 ORGANISM="Eutreptiella gymnastica-like, Strain CCMP1594" /NCGR_SAMPLE_ID=MMETSP0809 /ASSEMBLY_ACC=CAM_ASM_000658 /LENGTH=868 /DNA_ID=CAMNT_0015408975 /DNA_START=18 /DNA_END=2624 /DNA_ORIENTATION=+